MKGIILICVLICDLRASIIETDPVLLHAGRLVRQRRYLGLNSKYKLNLPYQTCVAPGDVQGHCKHLIFCPMEVTNNAMLDYLCVIDNIHVGVCCPDDIARSSHQGSHLIRDLPASGTDYEKEDQHSGCGLDTLTKSNLTVQRWPWIAALYRPEKNSTQFCGGSLITERHVLTAAHCFRGITANDVRIRLGEYNFLQTKETRSRNFEVASFDIHEMYNPFTYENDIAVVKLKSATSFNTYIWPICLPPIDRTFEGETATVAGWGLISEDGLTSEVLLQVSVPVWEHQRCVESYVEKISDVTLCAAGFDGGKDSCKGDSGGPLVYRLANERWVVIGIVSWGTGCGRTNLPGIYARVNKNIPWILSHTLM